MYCNCNFKRMIIIKKPMLWLSSMATMHDQDFPVFLLGERREGAEREWNLWVRFFAMIWIRISDARSLGFMVLERSRWIRDKIGFIVSFDVPWAKWSWITDSDQDVSKATQRSAICIVGYITFTVLQKMKKMELIQLNVIFVHWI